MEICFHVELAQRKEDKEQRISVIACMYSRTFVVELVTGLFKANMKRVSVVKDVVIDYFLSLVESCTYLNLEIQSVIECTFDLLYTCINYNAVSPIHKLFSVLTAITRLIPETFQALAPLLASGLGILVTEYGRTIAIIGCWETVVELLHACLAVPHAMMCLIAPSLTRRRCYRCIAVMFSPELADSLPPCTLSLIEFLLRSPFLTPEVFADMLKDLKLLSRNCWRIYTSAQLQTTGAAGPSIESLWLPVLQLVCQQCTREDSAMAVQALDVLERLMCDASMQLLPSTLYNRIVFKTLLPALKEMLLRATGISDSAGERQRVTRTRENPALERLGEAMVHMLKVRFESLLVLDGFTTLWSQVLSILQFIQTVSIPESPLCEKNRKAVAELLRHANTFDLFKMNGEFASELWKQTVHHLCAFKEDELRSFVNSQSL